MSFSPQQYVENEAWILFQLNDGPVQTVADGDFNVLALMDVSSGLIHGMEFVPSSAVELTEFEAKKILNSAEAKVGCRPKYLFIDATQKRNRLKRVADSLGIKIVPEERKNLDEITEEARSGFADRVMRGRSNES